MYSSYIKPVNLCNMGGGILYLYFAGGLQNMIGSKRCYAIIYKRNYLFKCSNLERNNLVGVGLPPAPGVQAVIHLMYFILALHHAL